MVKHMRKRDKGVWKYSGMEAVFMDHMAMWRTWNTGRHGRLWICRFVDSSSCIAGALGDRVHTLGILVKGYLLNGFEGSLPAGHEDFEHCKNWDSRSFFLVSWKRNIIIWVCPDAHFCVDCSLKGKRTMVKTLLMEEVVMIKTSLYVRHEHEQHAWMRLEAGQTLWYHIYMITEGAELKDNIWLAFRALWGQWQQKKYDNSLTWMIMMSVTPQF